MTGSTRVTIGDVADLAGVSIATVSRVVNGRYGVSTTTQTRVQAVIDDLGYESSLVARSLRSQRTNVIGVLVPDIEPFSAELLKGAAKAVRGCDFEMVVYVAGRHDSAGMGAALHLTSERHAHRRHDPRDADRDRRRRDAAGRRCRPPRGRIDPAHRRLAELRRCESHDRAPLGTRPPPHRVPRRPSRPRVCTPPRGRLPRGARGCRRRLRSRSRSGRRVHRGDRRGSGTRAAHAQAPADGDLRRQRPVGDPDDADRGRARYPRSRGDLGGRLRQHHPTRRSPHHRSPRSISRFRRSVRRPCAWCSN